MADSERPTSVWDEAPAITCPACGTVQYEDADFEVKLDAERDCECGARIVLVDESYTRRWKWRVKSGG